MQPFWGVVVGRRPGDALRGFPRFGSKRTQADPSEPLRPEFQGVTMRFNVLRGVLGEWKKAYVMGIGVDPTK